MQVLCPQYRIIVKEEDITAQVATRLVRLTLTECRIEESDQLDIVLTDAHGELALPERGVTLHVWLGWAHIGLVHKGHFMVDEIEYSGPPDILTIRARSATLSGVGRERIERSWHRVTLADIVKTIAQQQNLIPKIDTTLGGIQIAHVDQTHESDLHFLTRLANRYGALMSVKNGYLLFMPIGAASTVQGEAFDEVHLTREASTSYRYHIAERERYAGVRAYWYKSSQAFPSTRASVVIGKENGQGLKVLPEHYTSEVEARAAAQAEWQRIQRSQATLSLTLAAARPEFFPERLITLSGFKPEIEDTTWCIARATHTLENGGFTTSLDLDVQEDPASARHRRKFRQRTSSRFGAKSISLRPPLEKP